MNEDKKVENVGKVVEEMLGINDIVEQYALSPVYVRRMVQKGKLVPDKKVHINNNQNQFKYLFNRTTVEKWRKGCTTGVRARTDGRRKYNLYMTKEEVRQYEEFKKSTNFNGIVQLSNPGKSK